MSGPHVYVALQQFSELDESPRRLLEAAGCTLSWNRLGRRPLPEDLVNALQDADAVLAGVESYDAELFASLPRLKCISRCGAGTDTIDLDAARRRGVTVLTTADAVAEPVAQLTVGLMLALARNIPQYCRNASIGHWKKATGHLLSAWTIGLIGFGRIGRMVERYLRPFGPRVLVADPQLRVSDCLPGVERRELASLLADSDLVSLHVARRPEEGVLIGWQELALMKRGSYLVNTARGYLVDEASLHDSLASGHLAGAALDVFQEEPYTGPLARLPQVICTPHIGTLTTTSRIAMEQRCAQNVVQYFSSQSRLLGAPLVRSGGQDPQSAQADVRTV